MEKIVLGLAALVALVYVAKFLFAKCRKRKSKFTIGWDRIEFTAEAEEDQPLTTKEESGGLPLA
ncbi:MAG: hypothetical protein JWO38_4518 [Gemmataceae bacterium]|nr:hypothetical protein [Gemmataceae bacterium]